MAENIVVLPNGLSDGNAKLADKFDVMDYIDLKHRIVWLQDEIDVDTLLIARQIYEWNRVDCKIKPEDRKPIKLMFFSPGGSLDVCMSMIDVINSSVTPIYGINMGVCASAAAFIFLACQRRYMLPHSYFLFHRGQGALSGSYGEVISALQEYQDQVNELSDIVNKYTNFPKEEIDKCIVGEWYIRKEEAVAKGVVDEVITNMGELL